MDDLGGAQVGLLAHPLAVPQEMVQAAVDAEGVREKKRRALPSVLIVYLNLALWIFPDQGMRACLRELAAGMPQLVAGLAEWRNVASTSVSEARERVGPGVMWHLFSQLAGPMGGRDSRWWGRRVCAVDGTELKVPDSEVNAGFFAGPKSSPFPVLRLVALAECHTRSVINAVWPAYSAGERTLVHRLLPAFGTGMLVIFDRGFCSHLFFRDAAATGADLLFRVSASFSLAPVRVLEDGTYLARLNPRVKRDGQPITVRVIEYSVASTTTTILRRTTSEVFCLVTNLLNPLEAPAPALIGLYRQRWSIETVFKALKVDIGAARPVLRSARPETVIAEIWSLLAVYQILLRLAGAALIGHRPDGGPSAGPGEVSIKNAHGALRRTIGQAADRLGDMMKAFAEEVWATLVPARPPRTAPRKRKARRGQKSPTQTVKHTIIMHRMRPPTALPQAA
jgi:hypothetical protein